MEAGLNLLGRWIPKHMDGQKDGSGSVSRIASAEGVHGSCSRANTAGRASVDELDAAPVHVCGSTRHGGDEEPSNFNISGGDLHAAHAMASASGAARTCILPSDMDGSIQTLVPYGESDEEVALLDDDIAFCLRSMFASPGAPGSTAGGIGTSTSPHVAANWFPSDEAYARELEKKLERKEIDANDVGEDPLGVVARKDKATAWIRIQARHSLRSAEITGHPVPAGSAHSAPLKLQDRTPYLGRIGALEQMIQGYADKLGEHGAIGLTLDSMGETYDFYNLHSWKHGFAIRYGESRLNVEKTKCMQEVVCGCSGKPKIRKQQVLPVRVPSHDSIAPCS